MNDPVLDALTVPIALAVTLALVLSYAWLVTQLLTAPHEPEPPNAPGGEDNNNQGHNLHDEKEDGQG